LRERWTCVLKMLVRSFCLAICVAVLVVGLNAEEVSPKQCVNAASQPVRVGGSRSNLDFAMTPVAAGRPSWTARDTSVSAPVLTIITQVADATHLDETAKSVLSQTSSAFQWIIVNDGADSAAVNAMSKKDARITVVNCGTEKCGPSKARNTGVEAMQQVGETPYVLFLDSDDMLEKTYSEQLIWLLESNEEVSYANTYTVAFGSDKSYLWDVDFSNSNLEQNNAVVSGVVRTSALKQATAFPAVFDESITAGGEDWKLWLALKNEGLSGVTIPEYMFWQRVKTDDEKIERGFDVEAARAAFPDLYKKGHFNPVLYQSTSVPTISENVLAGSYKNKDCKRSVLLVVPWMALGGTDSTNLKLVQLLTEKGYQVTVINTLDTAAEHVSSPDLEFVRPELQKYTEDIHVLPHFVRTESYGDYLLHMIKSRGADVVMTSNSFAGYQMLPFIKAHAPTVAIVDYVHMRQVGAEMPAYFENSDIVVKGGFPKLSAQFAEYIDHSMFSSNDEQNWVAETQEEVVHASAAYKTAADRETFATPARTTVYNAVNAESEFVVPTEDTKEDMRTKYGIGEDELCIAFVGRIVEQKRPLVALQVLRRLLQHTEAHMLVVGTGPLTEEMFRFAADNNLWSHITFLGNVEHSKMASVLAAADTLLMPSEMEGLSVSLIESMAMGVVPVVTNVGGQSEIVVEGAGFLTAVDDVTAMTENLLTLATDLEAREAMSKKARAVVEQKFTEETMAQGVIAAIESGIAHAQETARFSDADVKKAATADQLKVAAFISKVDGKMASFVNRMNAIHDEQLSHLGSTEARPELTYHRRTGTGANNTNGTAAPTAAPGPNTPTTAPTFEEGSITITQVITFAFTSTPTGNTLTAVNNGVALAQKLGEIKNQAFEYYTGCSISSTWVSVRRAMAGTFTSVASKAQATAAQSASESLTADSLNAAMASIKSGTTLGGSVTIPDATGVAPPTVATNKNDVSAGSRMAGTGFIAMAMFALLSLRM
jgi:glycosyltransferase involved in cell wall biosynthesis